MFVIAIQPDTIASEGSHMNSVKGGDISGQELVGIYIIKGRDILHDKSISIAASFPKITSCAVWMPLCRADVFRTVQLPIVGALQHNQ
jgi:hypothetical protein